MSEVDCKTLIIGAGFGGLCMGIKLAERGETDFIIAEKADEVGGTWRENTYPGAECDIASALYSYSFAPNPSWDFKWAKQAQIHAYQKDIAQRYGLYAHIQFGRTVVSAAFEDGVWTTRFADGDVIRSQFLVSAIGQLHVPKMPDIAGADSFKGVSFHSARWDHSYDYAGGLSPHAQLDYPKERPRLFTAREMAGQTCACIGKALPFSSFRAG